VPVYFAECRDGTGSAAIEEMVEKFSSAEEMEREHRRGFVVGAHKAFWLARLGDRVKVLLASKLPPSLVEKCHLHPTADPQEVLTRELDRLGSGARVASVPHAGITLPAIEKGNEA
jgi:lactate racemase